MTLLNGGILLMMRIAFSVKSDAMYAFQNRMIPVERKTFNTVSYSLIEFVNVLWLFLNLVPFAALTYVGS